MNFNEAEWIRLLFLVSDTHSWIKEMEKDLFSQLALAEKKKLLPKNAYISASALVHILERHYHKIPRHPGTAKFTISVANILHWIREALQQSAHPIPGDCNFIRCHDTGTNLGHDQYGLPAMHITIITNAGNQVITAFPGIHKHQPGMTTPMLPIQDSECFATSPAF
jgi:hypothetical protein